MRIIENYHHDRGVTVAPKKRNKKYLKAIVFLLVLSLSGYFAINNANHDSYVVLNDEAEESPSEQLAADVLPLTTKNYDFSSIPFPGEGQVAFRVVGDKTWANSNEQAPMASITKVVTALAVTEKAPLDSGEQGEEITFTLQDEAYYSEYLAKQGTVTGVTAGQSISQYHALQAILLASSNNIADTLADHYFENQQDFVAYANSMLLKLELEDTTVADASGFNPSSVSTPMDLLDIGEYALANPVLATIVAQDEAVIMDGVRIPNYNALIGFDETNGIKPGFTDEAGYCLLFSALFPDSEGNNVQFVAVVMGIQDRAVYYDTLTTLFNGAKEAIASQ